MMEMSNEVKENLKEDRIIDLSDPDKEKIRNIWLDIIKREALEKNQEDVLMANDEEILAMVPMTLRDYEALLSIPEGDLSLDDEVLFWEMQEQIREAQEDIILCEKALNDPNIHYLQRTELQSDIVLARRRINYLDEQIQKLSDKYARRH